MKHGKYLTGLICLGLMAICLSACTNRNENSTEDASESVQMQTTEAGDKENQGAELSATIDNDDRNGMAVEENNTGNTALDMLSETEGKNNELPEVGISNNPAAVNAHNTSEKEQESPAGEVEMSTQDTDENIDKKENDDQESGDNGNWKKDQNDEDTDEKRDEEKTEDKTETGDVIRNENGDIMLPEVP